MNGGVKMRSIRWFDQISMADVADVGGKNASLGEMYQELAQVGVAVPNGFATTAEAFNRFLDENGLVPLVNEFLDGWDSDDVVDLERRAARVRAAIISAPIPTWLHDEIAAAYLKLSAEAGTDAVDVAVRSSATAEDLPTASFAGQQETFLMIRGAEAVAHAVRRCFASLFTARAVSYRNHVGIDHRHVSLSAGVQRMVRADLGSSGVTFTVETESGFPDIVYLTSTWGLGENIVQGRVDPDAFHVHKPRLRDGFEPLVGKQLGAKELRLVYDYRRQGLVNERTPEPERRRFSLSDDEVLLLARWAVIIEDHYSARQGRWTPMDIEWAKDGITGDLFIVQARPETVHSRASVAAVLQQHKLLETGPELVTGLAIGSKIGVGPVRRIDDPRDMGQLRAGEILVTDITDPDWEPVLERAAGLVTERGGRTSHAAIVARELDIPAIVGTGRIGSQLEDGQVVTISCAEGEKGVVYAGALDYAVEDFDPATLPSTETDIMINLGDPSAAYRYAQLPVAGVGLARMEYIFAGHIGVHPLALTRPGRLDPVTRRRIEEITESYETPQAYLVEQLALGIGTLAAAFWPRPVILRFSDFKTNEYAGLLGGRPFEPAEANPMLGWRGASRYHHPAYRDGFELEMAAVKRVRNTFGLTNLKVMIPFCRTPAEGRAVLDVLAEGGLRRGENDLEVYVMAEIPSNVFRADEFAELFDGFSIGSNDLTQLILGVDRDSERVAPLFDERDPAVTGACAMVIEAGHRHGRKVGICGQAPSDYPDFAAFLVEAGIDSISVTPDALHHTIERVAGVERTPAAVG